MTSLLQTINDKRHHLSDNVKQEMEPLFKYFSLAVFPPGKLLETIAPHLHMQKDKKQTSDK